VFLGTAILPSRKDIQNLEWIYSVWVSSADKDNEDKIIALIYLYCSKN